MIDKILRLLKFNLRKARAQKLRNKQDRVINWAIVGVGNMSRVFSKALMLDAEAKIAAVCSRSLIKAQNFAKSFGALAYSDYSEMLLNSAIDVIYIATPHKYHYQYIKDALLSSHNVICEKPIVGTKNELSELIKIAKEKGVFLMEGMWSACLPVNVCAKKWICDGKIGEVKEIYADLSKLEKEDITRAVFNKEEGGGVLMDYGIYTIAFAVMYMGEDIKIEKAVRANRKSGIDKSWDIVLCDGKIKAYITISSDNDGPRQARIRGDLGEIHWMPQFNRTNCIKLYSDNILCDEYKVNYISEGFEYEIKEVHRMVKEGLGESILMPLGASLRAVCIAEELLERE